MKKFHSINAKSGLENDVIREIRFLMHYSHQNIVKPNHLFLKAGKIEKMEKYRSIYMEMDYMIPLSDLIMNLDHKLSEDDFKFILFSILSGLAYLHKNGILHRV